MSNLSQQSRNICRSIWINVAPPPAGAPPPGIKGKTPLSDISPQQLRKRKTDALHLALSFVFAVKHYLREEDGLNWDDYIGVLPASFARYDETGFNTNMNASTATYAATADNTQGNNSRDASQASRSGRTSPDATKRVRAKRSKPKVSSGATTPLLGNTHSTVEFHPFAEHGSIPLPLMFVICIFKYHYVLTGCTESHTISPELSSSSGVKGYSKPLAQPVFISSTDKCSPGTELFFFRRECYVFSVCRHLLYVFCGLMDVYQGFRRWLMK